jgi:hypothetical protein
MTMAMELTANIPVSGIISTNEAFRTARGNRHEAAKLEKALRQNGYDAALYWMRQIAEPAIDVEYVTGFLPNGDARKPAVNILRAANPVFYWPTKILLLVAPSRDIDGYFIKPILDGFTDAHLWEDDWLVDEITFRRDYSLEETNTVIFQISQPLINFEIERAWAVFKNRYLRVRSKILGPGWEEIKEVG